MNQTNQHTLNVIRLCLVILTLIAGFAVLVIGRDFIYPVFLAILLAYLVYPLLKFIERFISHRIIATLLSVIISLVVVGGFIFFLYEQFSIFLEDLPILRDNARENVMALQLYLDRNTPLDFDAENTLIQGVLNSIGQGNTVVREVFNATTGTLVGLGLQPVYVYFLLYYRNHFREFLFKVVPTDYHDTLKDILKDISAVTNNYVSGVFIVVLILCFLNSIGLLIIGLDYAIMFGVLSAIMNFIPYFGTLIGAAFPLLYTLASDEPGNAISVLILFGIIQFTENNILTPNITGGRVAINPLITIFTIIIGSLAWGIPGMFLFVPFVGMFKVVCDHVEPLKPVAFLISPRRQSKNRIAHRISAWFKKKTGK